MTRDRGYPDWLVLSARLLRSGYHSAGCVWLVAMCSLLLYVVIFVTVSLIRLVSICYGDRGPDVPLTFRGCNGPGGIRPLVWLYLVWFQTCCVSI